MTIQTPAKTTTVYRRIRQEERTCELGCAHQVGVYLTKELTLTDRTVPDIEEYSGQPIQLEVWVDRQDRDYVCTPPTDYYGTGTYLRGDKVCFSGRVRDQIAFDTLGRRIKP